MIERTLKLYTKKEADEIINKYKYVNGKYSHRDIRKIQLVDNIAPSKGLSHKANCLYILVEYVRYNTNEFGDDPMWYSGVGHCIFREDGNYFKED